MASVGVFFLVILKTLLPRPPGNLHAPDCKVLLDAFGFFLQSATIQTALSAVYAGYSVRVIDAIFSVQIDITKAFVRKKHGF